LRLASSTIVVNQHLYLIGYRGSGKSSVAIRLAEKLGCGWIDTDVLIESTVNRTIREIFADMGEEGFRELETTAIEQAAHSPQKQVISLGGGAILREKNRRVITETGKVIWLQASPELLAQRILGDSQTTDRRPSLSGKSVLDEVREVLARRVPLYATAATWAIDTEHLSIDNIVDRILRSLDP
jgi:shikimate kinase